MFVDSDFITFEEDLVLINWTTNSFIFLYRYRNSWAFEFIFSYLVYALVLNIVCIFNVLVCLHQKTSLVGMLIFKKP